MAKVTFDKKVFTDARFINLCIAEGSRRTAMGALVELWLVAIEHVSPENPGGSFSLKKWQTERLSEHLFHAGFCSKTDDGMVVVTGGVEAYSWLVHKQIGARLGGIEASKRPRDAKGRLMSSIQPISSHMLDDTPASSQPDSSSDQPFITINSSFTNTNLKNKEVAKATSTELVNPSSAPADKNSNHISAVKSGNTDHADFTSRDPKALIQAIPHSTKTRWMALYDNDSEFIQRELLKAIGYYHDNPKKTPKSRRGWLMAFSSWLERGWTYRAKNIKGVKSEEMRRNEIAEAMRGDENVDG